MAQLGDYLEVDLTAARVQFRELRSRHSVAPGQRQVVFLPVETLLCLAASFLVDHTRFGSSTAARAPEPVPTLARMFKRPPSSVLAKMANLDGSRSHGGTWDQTAGGRLREDPAHFAHVYRTLMAAARAEGFDAQELPDFLALEQGGELTLIGQEELEWSVVEADLEAKLRRWHADSEDATPKETERILLGAIRVGQHVFASRVLANCGRRCVFCGLTPPGDSNDRLLVASHIKPWRDSSDRERRDHRNGLAACPTHDVAFDAGMLSVNGGLRIHRSARILAAIERDSAARHFFGQPPLRDTLLLPEAADRPSADYLRWHRERVFAA